MHQIDRSVFWHLSSVVFSLQVAECGGWGELALSESVLWLCWHMSLGVTMISINWYHSLPHSPALATRKTNTFKRTTTDSPFFLRQQVMTQVCRLHSILVKLQICDICGVLGCFTLHTHLITILWLRFGGIKEFCGLSASCVSEIVWQLGFQRRMEKNKHT